MHRKKWIKEIIGDCIEEYGFLYEGCAREGDIRMYSFVKKDKDLCKNIDIHVKSNKVRMILMTNVYGQEPIIASNLLESNFIKSTQNYLLFRDEEEFKAVLYHFREIILKKGISALEEISKPTTEARPRKETYWHLYTEHEKLNRKFRQQYELERLEGTVELMKKISGLILEKKNLEFAEVEEMLVGLAAVYGNQIIKKCGGEWEWDDNFNSCMIIDIWGIKSANPLNEVIFYWRMKREDLNHFLNPFKRFSGDKVV